MYDTLIKNGHVVDGSGNPAFAADVAIKDGKIAKVSPHITETAETAIDASGQYVTPGFIDIHRHSDAFVFRPGFGEIQLRQGITTTINGNCGLSIVPCPAAHRDEILHYLKPIVGSLPAGIEFETFSDYMNVVAGRSLPINFGMHIGDGTLRMAAKGFAAGELTDAEYGVVHRYLRDALDNGAFGVSMGVVYSPENNYDVDGFVKALEPMRGGDVPLVTHIRGEGNLLLESVREVAAVAARLGVPLHISHYKAVGAKNWRTLLAETTAFIEQERAAGRRITVDVYPWTAGSTQLVQVLPPEFLEGGLARTTERLRDPEERRRCKDILSRPQTAFDNQIDLVGWENIMVSAVKTEANKQYEGMRITEIAEARGQDPYEAAFTLLAEEDCEVSMVNFIVCEEDIATILNLPYSFIISDSIYPDAGRPHPRQYGNFPKLLSEYVRDRAVLPLERAVWKFTGGPAEGFNIVGKGFVREGYDADVAVFDLAAIKNNATYAEPKGLGEGFSYVLVNGRVANDHDSFINAGSGRALRRGRA